MDELIGRRHVRMTGVVIGVEPGREIVWQLKKVIRLPVRLTLELADQDGGVDIRHTITAGGMGPMAAAGPAVPAVLLAAFCSCYGRACANGVPACA